jgi:hypothetical protein
MIIRLTGTPDEIDAAIAKLEALLTVYERDTPEPIGGGQVKVRIGVQL